MSRVNQRLNPAQTGLQATKLESDLRNRVVGQDEAIEQIVNIYQTDLAGMSCPGRPIGAFLFLGPTGSGKTRTVEAVAESLLGDPHAVIKIDCAEFQHSHEIAKLIGSPPGYLGHRETHPMLSQEVLNQYHTEDLKVSFVLFDEIEKASDALWNLLLGIPFNVSRVERARGARAFAFGQRCAHLVLFRPACPRRSGTTTRHADPDTDDGAASSTRTGFVR